MSTATTPTSLAAPAPLEMPGGPVARVPSLDELRRLTEVPDRRVVFRGVDWDFYDRLVDSIPESSRIHVDYDGRDLEVMAKGRRHEKINWRLDQLIGIIADEWGSRPGIGGRCPSHGAAGEISENPAGFARQFRRSFV